MLQGIGGARGPWSTDMSKLYSELGMTPEQARALVERCKKHGLIEDGPVVDVDQACADDERERSRLYTQRCRARQRAIAHRASRERLQKEWVEARP